MLRMSNPLVDPDTTQFRIEKRPHATQKAINTTNHTTLKYLVFGRDMIMPTTYLANEVAIQHPKQEFPMQQTNR